MPERPLFTNLDHNAPQNSPKVVINILSHSLLIPLNVTHFTNATSECTIENNLSSLMSVIHSIIKQFREFGGNVLAQETIPKNQYQMAVIFSPSGCTELKTDTNLLWESLHWLRKTSVNHYQQTKFVSIFTNKKFKKKSMCT